MKNLRAVIEIYKKITFILTSQQKRGAFYSFVSMIVCALLELLGVSVIYPFLQLIIDKKAFDSKWYVRYIYSIFPNLSNNIIIVVFCFAIILVFITKNAMAVICSWVQNKYAERLMRELGTEVFASVMKRPYEYFSNTSVGTIIRNVQTGPSVINDIVTASFQFMTDALTALMIGIYLIKVDWKLAIATLILACLCFLVIVLGFKKRIKRIGKQQWNLAASKFQICSQTINGIKEIIVMNKRGYFYEQYENESKKVESINVLYKLLSACPDRLLEGVCMSGFLLLVCLRIGKNVDMTSFVSTLGVFAMGAFKVLPSISKMASRVNSVIYQFPGLNECYDNIVNIRKKDSRVEPLGLENATCENNSSLGAKHSEFDSIEVRDIVWKYGGSSKNTLDHLDLVIRKGESVALIGESGAGKTTLADVILGLYQPKEGSVMVDGVDIWTIPDRWSRLISYVPQSIYLFDDSVRNNIAFGVRTEEISEEKIWEALSKAHLDTFVRGLPHGLDTIVGERGVKFSGGQRQRVAIARALYNDPQILVLDEATSALDNNTETEIMEAIDALRKSKTLIIIAHRLSTIRNCDSIYEIVNGRAERKDKSDIEQLQREITPGR